MHQLNVLAFGPNSFINTLIELKSYLKFNLSNTNNNLDKNLMDNYDILLFHEEFLEKNNSKDIIDNLVTIKVLASTSLSKAITHDAFLKLPASINEINFIIENSAVKKKFIKNSSIKIKNYSLDKNEKKLSKNNSFIILTEKEIQLLELFLNNTLSISKKEILSKVWHYSSDADTHTVETHIYRLRKKINDKFSDDKFILNDRNGYSF